MSTTGFRPVPPLPVSCLNWCRAQPPALVVADEYVEIDLDRWSLRLWEQGIDLQLVASGPDGGLVESGTGFLRRSDLWAAGRRAKGSIEEAVTALYMCAAWLSGHPQRTGIRRGLPDFRVPDRGRWTPPSQNGFPLVLLEVVDWLESPAEAMRLVRHGSPHDSLARGVPDLGFPLAAMYLSSLAMAWSDRPLVPVDPAGIGTLVHAGWTEFESSARLTPRRYERYLDVVAAWATEAAVDPLMVEMWLVHHWHERRAEGTTSSAPDQDCPRGRPT